MDFHSQRNIGTYASRVADASWSAAMRSLVDPIGLRVADTGCGGGIYTRAWSNLGSVSVVGVDFSAQMVTDAREASASWPGLSFIQGDATATGLPDATFDVVFSRAVVHHLPDILAAFKEAHRILNLGGTLIVQDRTIDDVCQPASPEHLRGYFFELFPRLLQIEEGRRPSNASVIDHLREAGYEGLIVQPLYEQRRTYATPTDLERDLRARTGRSILHELVDEEIEQLVIYVLEAVAGRFPLHEVDRWTVWSGRKR